MGALRNSILVAAASSAVAVLLGGSAGMAAAAQNALPGEALYPVKRGIESAQLQLVSGPDRGRAQLANAADRSVRV